MCERVGEDSTEVKERDREKKCDTEGGGGGSCGCVSACERCTILAAAARVMPYSNPCIKTSADSLRQITDIFPLSPPALLLNDDQGTPLTFVMCKENVLFVFFFHQYLLSYQ